MATGDNINTTRTFDSWATSYGLVDSTVKLLQDNGIMTAECAKLLSPEIIQNSKQFKSLSLGQSLLLQEAVASLIAMPKSTPQVIGVTSETATTSGAENPDNNRDGAETMDVAALLKILDNDTQPKPSQGKILSFDPFDFDLSNTQACSNKAKLREIKDYVAPDQTHEKQTVTLGGIELSIPESRPKLESVTPLQYIGASLKIVREMVLDDGADIEVVMQYIGYIIKIANMGQRFNWQSVLKYDSEYRKYQATGHFPWGADNAWAMLMFLKDNTSKPLHIETHTHTQHGYRRNIHDPHTGNIVCEKFNGRQGCSLKACRYAHTCKTCFSGTHGEFNHTRNPQESASRFQSKNL